MLKLIQTYYKFLSLISPQIAANSAFELFQKVRVKKIRDREKPFYEQAEPFTLAFDNENIQGYQFGKENEDIVILLHGWDSNVGSLYKFVDELLLENKRIISMNLPGHAFYKSSKTNLYECKTAFKVFLSHLPKDKKITIISHSFGSAIVAYALSELKMKVDKLVFLTSPNYIEDVFLDFKKIIKINDKAYKRMVKKADIVLDEKLENLVIQDKLQSVSYNHLHLFHDEKDKVIPYKNSVDIHENNPNSSLISYRNIGHYRMLWNDDLISEVMNIVRQN